MAITLTVAAPAGLQIAAASHDWHHGTAGLSTGHVTRQGVIPAMLKSNTTGSCVDQLRYVRQPS